MFTGLIEHTGIISQALEGAADRLIITSTLDTNLGDSIAVNGCCLTVVSHDEIDMDLYRTEFDVMAETIQATALGDLQMGDTVNLEAALAVGDRLGGHIVQGHVDCVGEVLEIITSDGEGTDAHDIYIQLDPAYEKYVISKGSIAINGVSLTVMGLTQGRLHVSLIPETIKRTAFRELSAGSMVNIEVDMLGKYVESLLAAKLATITG